DDAAVLALAHDHLGRRPPVRPFLHPTDMENAVPAEALAPDPDAIADRLVLAEYVEKEVLAGIDDDGAGRFLGREGHLLAVESGRGIVGVDDAAVTEETADRLEKASRFSRQDLQ